MATEQKPSRRQRLVQRIRHAKNPVKGPVKWAIIGLQGLAGLAVLFLIANLTLSLSTFRGDNPLFRTAHEVGVLWFSTTGTEPTSDRAFRMVHGWEVGTSPTPERIREHFITARSGGSFLLDQVMIDRMIALNGRIDSQVLPPGVYVGAHALGPDKPPLVWVTKWFGQYLLFARHAYILVVPETGSAIVFSASQKAKFFGSTDDPQQLSARLGLYDSSAYDFPGSGQALHEMTVVSEDPAIIANAPAALDAARQRLEATNTQYGLLAPNSNTVVGCILDDAGMIRTEVRRSILLALRAPGLGASCPRSDRGS